MKIKKQLLVSLSSLIAVVFVLSLFSQQGRPFKVFPPPAYDSGWVSIAPTATLTLYHGLDIHPDNLVVDLQFTASGDLGLAGVNNQFYGTGYTLAGFKGAYWHGLTENSIFVFREADDLSAEKVRVRIWSYE